MRLAAACRLARADAPVQIRLGALKHRDVGKFGSIRGHGAPESAGSNPAVPTEQTRCGVVGVPAWFGTRRTPVQVRPSRLPASRPADRPRPARRIGTTARLRQLVERPRLNRGGCGFDSHAGHRNDERLGRQPDDHRDSESRMLRVRLPPEPLQRTARKLKQMSSRLSTGRVRVRVPCGPLVSRSVVSTAACPVPTGRVRVQILADLLLGEARYANSAKRPGSNPGDSVGSTPTRVNERLRRPAIERANPPVKRLPNGCGGSSPSRRTDSWSVRLSARPPRPQRG